ncbi:MAG: ABC transporter ATP-binding protein [Bacteroidota bacterium]
MSDSSDKQQQKPKPKAQSLWRLLSLGRTYSGYYVVGILLTILLSGFMVAQPYIIKRLIDGPIKEENLHLLNMGILLIVSIIFVQAIAQYFQTWLSEWLGQTIMNDLRQRVFHHIMALRMRYFDTHAIGQLQTRTISDIEALNQVFSQAIIQIIGQILQLIAIMAFMFYTDVELTLVVLTVFPLITIATYIFRKRVEKPFQKVREYVSRLNAFVQEHITGLMITKLYNREEEEEHRFEQVNAQHLKANLATVLYYSIFFPVVEILSALGTALLIWYGLRGVAYGELTLGEIIMFNMLTTMMFRPVRMIAERFNQLLYGMVSAERVFRVLDTEEFIHAPTASDEDKVFDAEGQVYVEFKDVTFAYNPPETILHELSFEVLPGTTTAIVGPTGAGKSSIINVLMRFYDIQSGHVFLNGVDMRELSLRAIRENIGLVLQDVFLFSGTIHDNITLMNPEISRETVIKAAKRVGAHNFIESLPGGYDYEVGERGATLSTGQRQLFTFIRVLVYDPKVLLLDEATANIDTATETLIQNAIQTVLSGRTSIIIAHRLSTIQHADQIIVLKKGRIQERGNHQQLLAQGGLYKQLYELQYNEELMRGVKRTTAA